MSDLIERATKAAWEALSTADPYAYRTPLGPLEHWSDEADGMVPVSPAGCNFDGELDLDAVVRAVIAALREPTEAMIEAALKERIDIDASADKDWDFRIANSDFHVWQAMIDASLAKGEWKAP